MTTTAESPTAETTISDTQHTDAKTQWHLICPLNRLLPERGVAALIADVQIALFRTHDGELYAIGNIDPFTGAAVLSRGIVGSRGETPTVASPLHKQVFDLATGRCLDSAADAPVSVPSYAVRVVGELVEVAVPVSDPADSAGGPAQL